MTALLFLVCVAYPVDLRGRPRHYFAAFLFLEAASLGVFLALDLFLFYVFFDVGEEAVLTVENLEPGEYGMVCFVPGPDGKPHAFNGMAVQFTVD